MLKNPADVLRQDNMKRTILILKHTFLFILLLSVSCCKNDELKFSLDADVYDKIDNTEMFLMDSLADRGINVQYTIKYIFVHCTGSQSNRPITKAELDRVFKARGWNGVWGYHYVINPTEKMGVLSSIKSLQADYITPSQVRYGVSGYNSHSIHIAWAGGYDGKDGRTNFQKSKLVELITTLKKLYPKAVVLGHSQIGNVAKTCCNYNAYEEYKDIK